MSDRSLWLSDQPLVLASGSTIRRDMLVAAGIPVEVVRPDVDERAIELRLQGEGASGDRVARTLATAKAEAASRLHPTRLVLAADQTLVCEGRSFHKPEDQAQALAQLTELAGRSHTLHSAFALARAGRVLGEGADVATLTMHAFGDGFLARYLMLAGPSVLTSVGGYQIEGLGAQLFDRVDGNHFTILGLPLLLVLSSLRQQGCLIH